MASSFSNPPDIMNQNNIVAARHKIAPANEGAHDAPDSFNSHLLLLERTRLDLIHNSNNYYHDNIGLIRRALTNTTDSSGSSLIDHLDQRDSLIKMKKALKQASINVSAHLENEIHLAKVLENVATSSLHHTNYNNNRHNNNNNNTPTYYDNNNQQEILALAYLEFSNLSGHLSDLVRNLMHSLSNRVIFPLETMLKNDIKCSLAEIRRPVEKSLSDYELKLAKSENIKKAKKKYRENINNQCALSPNAPQQCSSEQQQQNHPIGDSTSYHVNDNTTNTESSNSPESTTPLTIQPQLAEKEKRIFQLHLCEYLIRINEIKTRRGVDTLQHLVEHFQFQTTFFREGVQLIEQYQDYVRTLSQNLNKIKLEQDYERKQLLELKNHLKETSNLSANHRESRADSTIPPPTIDDIYQRQAASLNMRRHSVHGYNLHQLRGNPTYGLNKTGYLMKKSVGKMHVKAWRKRRCVIRDGYLNIYHSDKSKTPTKLSLLTCQVKPMVGEDRKSFDLISFNRTYHFQVEDEADLTSWICVLINNKESALKREFYQGHPADSPSLWPTDSTGPITKIRHSVKHSNDNRQALINQIRTMPGNHKCVDCSATTNDVTWLSTNLGILVCIECSGIHRDLGVQVSRIQSLTLDKIGTSHLLIAHSMSNDSFNEIFEADKHASDIPRLHSASTMSQRCDYIRSKYIDKKLCIKIHRDRDEQLESLRKAILQRDLKLLLQLLAEGFDITSYLPDSPIQATSPTDFEANDNINETSLHLAIRSQSPLFKLPEYLSAVNCSPGSALAILDFIIQNGRQIDRPNVNGDTALHYCVKYDLIENAKLLLRSGADMHLKNNSGLSPFELAHSMLPGSQHFVDLMELSCENRKALLEDVNPDWNISSSTLADSSYDYGSSDEENDTNFFHVQDGSIETSPQDSYMDENDNSLSFVNQCARENGDQNHCTPVKNFDRLGYTRQRAYSEQHNYLAERKSRNDGFKTPKPDQLRKMVDDGKRNSSYSLYQHFSENRYDQEGMPENRSMTLDRSASTCQPQALWSQSLSKSKQLSSIFGLSPRSHRFSSSFRRAKNYNPLHTPTSYLRRAVNRERVQKVRQLLRFDSIKS